MIRRVSGLALLGLAAVLAVAWWTPFARAESVTVGATVTSVKGITLTQTSVLLPAGAPGATVESSKATCVSVASNSPTGGWSLTIKPKGSSFIAPTGAQGFPTSLLKWRVNAAGDPNGYVGMDPTQGQNVDSAIGAKEICLDFQLRYPANAAAGTYSTVVDLILS